MLHQLDGDSCKRIRASFQFSDNSGLLKAFAITTKFIHLFDSIVQELWPPTNCCWYAKKSLKNICTPDPRIDCPISGITTNLNKPKRSYKECMEWVCLEKVFWWWILTSISAKKNLFHQNAATNDWNISLCLQQVYLTLVYSLMIM